MPASTLENDVRLEVIDCFVAHQRPPTSAELARSLDASLQQIKAAMETLAEAHVLVLKPTSREVWMAMPFSAVPTDFRVLVGGKAWWAN